MQAGRWTSAAHVAAWREDTHGRQFEFGLALGQVAFFGRQRFPALLENLRGLPAGIGHGADMLRPLAIGIIGALCISMVFSLIATPTVYCLIMRSREKPASQKLTQQE